MHEWVNQFVSELLLLGKLKETEVPTAEPRFLFAMQLSGFSKESEP